MGVYPPTNTFAIVFVALSVAVSQAHIQAQNPLITAAPNFRAAPGLQQKDSGAICAYVNGDPKSPLSCPGASVCIYVGASWGCCDAVACHTPAICEGFGTPYCGIVGSANCVYSQIEQCTDAASPACVKYIRETGPGDEAKKTSWGCAARSTTIIVLAQATGLASPAASSTSASTIPSTFTPPPSSLESSINPKQASSSSEPSPPTSPTLSLNDKIGLGVGVPAAFCAVIGLLISIVKCLRKRKVKP